MGECVSAVGARFPSPIVAAAIFNQPHSFPVQHSGQVVYVCERAYGECVACRGGRADKRARKEREEAYREGREKGIRGGGGSAGWCSRRNFYGMFTSPVAAAGAEGRGLGTPWGAGEGGQEGLERECYESVSRSGRRDEEVRKEKGSAEEMIMVECSGNRRVGKEEGVRRGML